MNIFIKSIPTLLSGGDILIVIWVRIGKYLHLIVCLHLPELYVIMIHEYKISFRLFDLVHSNKTIQKWDKKYKIRSYLFNQFSTGDPSLKGSGWLVPHPAKKPAIQRGIAASILRTSTWTKFWKFNIHLIVVCFLLIITNNIFRINISSEQKHIDGLSGNRVSE